MREMVFAALLALCGVLALTSTQSCKPKPDKFGNKPIADEAIYVRDAQGRCLRIVRDVSFNDLSKTAKLVIYEVSETDPCLNQTERTSGNVKR